MSVKFLRGGEVFDTEACERSLNLLAHAQLIDLEIGSQCGGHGVCGGDRIRTQAPGLSPLTEEERRHLSPDEISEGWRLACQCFPENSGQQIDIELPPISGTVRSR